MPSFVRNCCRAVWMTLSNVWKRVGDADPVKSWEAHETGGTNENTWAAYETAGASPTTWGDLET